MKATFHVGLQKTASTMLQRNLNRNRAKLAKAGVGYHRLRPLNETDDAAHLPAVTSALRAFAMPRRQRPTDDAVLAEVEWLHSQGYEQVILSDENTLGPINHESGKPAYANAAEIVDWLVSTIRPNEYRVVLYVRRQDGYLESTYTHRVHVGKSIAFEKYMKRVDTSSFDWDALATRIAASIGRGNLHVVPYETIENGELFVLNRFLELAGTGIVLKDDDLAARTSNRSYSGIALEMALRCNELLEGKDLRIFREFLQNNFSNATHPRPELLTPEHRERLVKRFTESNAAVMRKFSSPEDRSERFA